MARRDRTDYCFRTLVDGTKVFYPAGMFGRRGYIVESKEDELAIRSSLIRYTLVTVCLAMAAGAPLGFLFISNALRADPWPSPSSVLTFVMLIFALSVAATPIDLLARALYFRRFTAHMQPIVTPNDSSLHLREILPSMLEDSRAYQKYIVIYLGFLGLWFAIVIVSFLLLMAIPAFGAGMGPAL